MGKSHKTDEETKPVVNPIPEAILPAKGDPQAATKPDEAPDKEPVTTVGAVTPAETKSEETPDPVEEKAKEERPVQEDTAGEKPPQEEEKEVKEEEPEVKTPADEPPPELNDEETPELEDADPISLEDTIEDDEPTEGSKGPLHDRLEQLQEAFDNVESDDQKPGLIDAIKEVKRLIKAEAEA